MLDTKFKIPVDLSKKLSLLGTRTNLSLNLICRLAFAVSINEQTPPYIQNTHKYDKDIAKHILVGDYEIVFISLLKQRLHEWKIQKLDNQILNTYFSEVIYRGINTLSVRVKSPTDILEFIV